MADDYCGLDVLSSQMDVKTSNFRRVPALPIYGCAQPTSQVVDGCLCTLHLDNALLYCSDIVLTNGAATLYSVWLIYKCLTSLNSISDRPTDDININCLKVVHLSFFVLL